MNEINQRYVQTKKHQNVSLIRFVTDNVNVIFGGFTTNL